MLWSYITPRHCVMLWHCVHVVLNPAAACAGLAVASHAWR
jgi:hypothetical protein